MARETRMSSQNTPLSIRMPKEALLSQECKKLISTLPKFELFTSVNFYQYQGFWFPSIYLQGVINCQKHFEAKDSDMFLATFPKSGTTWLKAIIYTLLNRNRNPVAQDHPLLTHNPHDLVPFLETHLYGQNETPDLASCHSPRLFSTHMPYTFLPESVQNSSSCKIVYLCRNPKDIYVSSHHFDKNLMPQGMKGLPDGEKFEMFCKGITTTGPVWDHALTYWKQSKENPERVLFLKYEDMKDQPGLHLRRLAGFLGCPISPEEEELGLVDKILNLCSFDSLRSLDINKNGKTVFDTENKHYFRRGVVGDWRNHLSAEMAEKLDQIAHDKFSGSGLVL